VRRLAPLLLPLVLLVAARPQAASRPRLYVVAFKAPPALLFTGKRLAQAVAAQAVKSGAYDVLGPDAIEERLGHHAYARLVECGGEARCIADADVALEADRVVGGQLLARESTYEVRASLVDLKSGEAVSSFARAVPIGSSRLVSEVSAASDALLRGESEGTGVLFVSASAPRAEVKIDGVVTGYTPLTARLKPGKHDVEVEKDGYAKALPQSVEIADGDVADVAVSLTPLSPGSGGDVR